MRAARTASGLVHYDIPLVVRASLPSRFLSLGVFTEAAPCFPGIYLLREVIGRPLETSEAEVLIAGVLLALATILLFYMMGPKRRIALAKHERGRRGGEMRLESPSRMCDNEALLERRRAEKAQEKEQLPGPM